MNVRSLKANTVIVLEPKEAEQFCKEVKALPAGLTSPTKMLYNLMDDIEDVKGASFA